MTDDRPTPRLLADRFPRPDASSAGDGVATLPDHVQYVLVGRDRYERASRYRLVAWLRETDDPQRVMDQAGEKWRDLHWERRTSTHERVDVDTVAADRDAGPSVRDFFRKRGDRPQ